MDAASNRPPHHRTKSSSFSFRSDKSSKSNDTPYKAPKIKVDLHESPEEKMKARFNSKTIANPNQPILDAQPSTKAVVEETTLLPLRGTQYRDWQGNVITDPDLSNPVRPRLERPLDTIRSFEAAIDGGHRQRSKMIRSESAGDLVTQNSSRRSSMHGSDFNVNPRSTVASSSPFYQQPPRRTTYRDPYEQLPRGPPSSYQKRNGMNQRMVSAPAFTRASYTQDYSQYTPPQSYHGYYDSIDTTGDSSGTSEPWTNNTEPSSENSSVDRIHAARYSTDVGDTYMAGTPYGRNSPPKSQTPGHNSIAEETLHATGYQGQYNQQSSPYQARPVAPGKNGQQYMQPRGSSYGPRVPPPSAQQYQQHQPARNVIPLGQPSIQRPSQPSYEDMARPSTLRKKSTNEQPEKRQSWLKRTFSRSKR